MQNKGGFRWGLGKMVYFCRRNAKDDRHRDAVRTGLAVAGAGAEDCRTGVGRDGLAYLRANGEGG